MTCGSCGAANPETARFCGQCYEVFSDPEPQPPALESVPAEVVSGVTELGSVPVAADARPAVGSAQAGRFVTQDGRTLWTCAVCETQHPLDRFVCDICGTKMDAEPGGTGPDQADWDDARRIEWLVPGLGHIRTGQDGMGYARLGVVALWLIGLIVLLIFGGVPGLLVSLPLLFGIIAVWGTGSADVLAAKGGREPRLNPRRFMYVVIGVTAGLILMGGVAAIL